MYICLLIFGLALLGLILYVVLCFLRNPDAQLIQIEVNRGIKLKIHKRTEEQKGCVAKSKSERSDLSDSYESCCPQDSR